MSIDNQPFIYIKPKHKKVNPIKFSKSTSPLSHSLTVVDYYDEVANEKPVNVFKEKVPSPNNYTNFKMKVKINCKEDLKYADEYLVYTLDVNDNFKSNYLKYSELKSMDIKYCEYIAIVNKQTNLIEYYEDPLKFKNKHQNYDC